MTLARSWKRQLFGAALLVPGAVGTVATQTVRSVGLTVDRVLALGDPVGALASKLGLTP